MIPTLPILADNSRILAGSFRSMTTANTTSKTALVQRGTVLTLSSFKEDGELRIAFRMDVREPRDRYVSEIRDITNMAFDGTRLIIESDCARMEYRVVESLDPVPCRCPGTNPTYSIY
ncbi:MAG: hypothetical protein ACI381_04000 [Candidatus Methanomethylophilaceae archaeon]